MKGWEDGQSGLTEVHTSPLGDVRDKGSLLLNQAHSISRQNMKAIEPTLHTEKEPEKQEVLIWYPVIVKPTFSG